MTKIFSHWSSIWCNRPSNWGAVLILSSSFLHFTKDKFQNEYSAPVTWSTGVYLLQPIVNVNLDGIKRFFWEPFCMIFPFSLGREKQR